MPSLNNLGKVTKKNKIQPSRRERQPPAHNPQENLQMSNITGFKFELEAVKDFYRPDTINGERLFDLIGYDTNIPRKENGFLEKYAIFRCSVEEMMDAKDLGDRVYEVRTSLKMTQVEFGKAINLKNYQISRYEHGKDEMSIFVAMRICKTFDIAIEDFLRDIYKEEEATHAKTQ